MTEPVMKIDVYGTKQWYLNGKLHREDGPAIEYANGSKFWYLNARRHREDGPVPHVWVHGGDGEAALPIIDLARAGGRN